MRRTLWRYVRYRLEVLHIVYFRVFNGAFLVSPLAYMAAAGGGGESFGDERFGDERFGDVLLRNLEVAEAGGDPFALAESGAALAESGDALARRQRVAERSGDAEEEYPCALALVVLPPALPPQLSLSVLS